MSTSTLIYITEARPFPNKIENRIEIFNELCILLFTHGLLNLLRVEIPPNLKEIFGIILIVVICLNIFVNLSAMGFINYKMMRSDFKYSKIKNEITRKQREFMSENPDSKET